MNYFKVIYDKLKSKTNSQIVIVLACILFIPIYSLLTLESPTKFTSPDENLDSYFVNIYSKTGSLSYYEPLNSLADGFARPRSTSSKNGFVSPATFPGYFVVFGTFGAISRALIPYLTPVVAAIGGVFMYLLVRQLFHNNLGAFFSAIILFALPPYWLWSSATYFNNLAASVFLLGGVTFFFIATESKKFGHYLALASCLALDCLFRTTDITYLIPFAVLVVIFREKIIWRYASIATLVFALIISPVFLLNKELNGSVLSFGYGDFGSAVAHQSFLKAMLNKISDILLPAGIQLRNMFSFSFEYIFKLLPFLIALTVIGILQSYRLNKITRSYSIYFILLSAWIITYYGSGIYSGSSTFTLFASYTRYFLPIYIFAVPLAVSALSKLPSKIFFIATISFLYVSATTVYSASGGLRDTKHSRELVYQNSQQIISKTKAHSVIFTTYSDKYIFPERKVIIFGPGYVPKLFSNEKLVNMVIRIKLKTDRQVYIFNDRKDLNIEFIKKLLISKGYSLEPTGLTYGYRVGP